MRSRIALFSLLAVAASSGECGGDDRYEPCAGKACGDACTVCSPDDRDCVETAVIKACDPEGRCVPAGSFTCTSYDPCAGKACGDECRLCPPERARCVETDVLKACDASGLCVPRSPSLTCP